MLRIIVLIATFIVVRADSTLNGFSPSNDGLKSYDYGSRNSDKYSRGTTKYFISSGSSPGHINSLSSTYPTSIYADSNQGESHSSQSVRNYQNVDNSYLSDAPTTISSYSRDRPYALSNSDYTSSLSSQADYTGSSNSQSGFSGRTDYESSAPVSDYTGSATQQFTVGTSYRGSSIDSNYPSSQDTSSIRGFVSQGSSPTSSGFIASPTYNPDTSNRAVYTGSGFKALDTTGFRGYYPTTGTREFVSSGKHRGQVFSSKYPIYENAPSDGFSGNEVDYASNSPHAYSTGNYKRESFNSGGSPLHSGFSASGLNYLSGSLKSAYPFAGLKPQSVVYPGPRESGPLSVPYSGAGAHGSDGRIIVSGGNSNYASYPSSPFLTKGHGSYLLGSGSGKFIIMKDNSSGGSHLSGSVYPGHMYASAPVIKTTRNADFGSQSPSFSYSPSFAAGSSPSYASRFITRGGSPYSPFMSAS